MIKLKCPDCSQDIEAPDEIMKEESVTCPTCAREFKPVRRLPDGFRTDPMISPEQKHRYAKSSELPAGPGLAAMAEKFVLVAVVVGIIGALAVGFGIEAFLNSAGSDDRPTFTPWLVAGVCFSLGLWLFLIGQLIHIRALLARKP